MRTEIFFGRIFALAVGAVLVFVGAGCKQGPVNYGNFEKRTIVENLAAVDSAGAVYDALFYAGNVDAACESARAILLMQPGVERAGIAEDSTVWAVFSSGLVAGCGPDTAGMESPPREAPAEVRTQSGGEVGSWAHYVLPHTDQLPATKYAATQIKRILRTRLGWVDSDSLTNEQVDLGAALGVIKPGTSLLYWNGHGTLVWFKDGEICTPGICLGVSYSSQQLAEQAVRNWGEFMDPDSGQPHQVAIKRLKSGRYRLVILPAFIRANADFDTEEDRPDYNQAKTIVQLGTCHGAYNYGNANSFLQAFHDKGADVVCGYDWEVTSAWAADNDVEFFSAMADSCFPGEAVAAIGSLTDPNSYKLRSAHFRCLADSMVLLSAVFLANVDQKQIRGVYPVSYSRNENGAGMLAYMRADDDTNPEPDMLGHLSVGIPAGTGNFDCTTTEYANIQWMDFASERVFAVQKGFKGVSGTIEVQRNQEDAIIGRFFGTLGWWNAEQNHFPNQDPPDLVVSVVGGTMRATGKIPKAGSLGPQPGFARRH
jgi:hypothetical protein